MSNERKCFERKVNIVLEFYSGLEKTFQEPLDKSIWEHSMVKNVINCLINFNSIFYIKNFIQLFIKKFHTKF
jgi:hypothetical protein